MVNPLLRGREAAPLPTEPTTVARGALNMPPKYSANSMKPIKNAHVTTHHMFCERLEVSGAFEPVNASLPVPFLRLPRRFRGGESSPGTGTRSY